MPCSEIRTTLFWGKKKHSGRTCKEKDPEIQLIVAQDSFGF
jgi:hypothetical protein